MSQPGPATPGETIEVPREEYEQLVERIENLEKTSVTKSSLNVLLTALVGSDALEDMRDDPVQLRDELADVGEQLHTMADTVADLEERLDAMADDGKTDKVGRIVEYAANTRDPHQEAVVVKPKEMVGVAGVSRRYAYDLIDDLADEFGWAHRNKDVARYGDMEADTDSRPRGLLIDFNGKHGSAVSVNKFTTRISEKGGEE